MELAVWDYLNIQIQNILLVAGNSFREIIEADPKDTVKDILEVLLEDFEENKE